MPPVSRVLRPQARWRRGQRVVRGVAGCDPAVTRSATAWRGVAGGDQALADEHGVGAGRGVADQVVRAADAGLGHLHHARRQPGRDPLEGGAVDLAGWSGRGR